MRRNRKKSDAVENPLRVPTFKKFTAVKVVVKEHHWQYLDALLFLRYFSFYERLLKFALVSFFPFARAAQKVLSTSQSRMLFKPDSSTYIRKDRDEL